MRAGVSVCDDTDADAGRVGRDAFECWAAGRLGDAGHLMLAAQGAWRMRHTAISLSTLFDPGLKHAITEPHLRALCELLDGAPHRLPPTAHTQADMVQLQQQTPAGQVTDLLLWHNRKKGTSFWILPMRLTTPL